MSSTSSTFCGIEGGQINMERINSKSIVVIHPGSLNLRIGRACDTNPTTVLNCIARKCLNSAYLHKDSFIPTRAALIKSTNCNCKKHCSCSHSQHQDLKEARSNLSHMLLSYLQLDGKRRYATPPQQLAAFNRRSRPEVVAPDGGEWLEPKGDCIVGNDVLRLKPDSNFNVHFPIKRGDLNLHGGPGGSLTAVIADLKTIWTYVLENHLKIRYKHFKSLRAVLIVPNVYNRTHLRELMYLLLRDMGFHSAFFVQDHVAATFGSGLSSACVVDVGDQKTSVSCVEDGMCHPNTRVRLDYGGGDIAQVFYWLLQKCGFPYKSCDTSKPLDCMFLRKLKEDCCHVNMNICGPQQRSFVIAQPNRPVLKYIIQMGDECLMAPLSLFTPELFFITGAKSIHTQRRCQGDPEDCYDEIYLRDIRRKGIKEIMSDQLSEPAENMQIVSNDDDATVDCTDLGNYDREFVVAPGQLLALDQAILQSIDRCPNEYLKRKMYGCILIIGSGMKFCGIDAWLKNRMISQLPYAYRGDSLDIITSSKDMDPSTVAWKGACIMSCLDSSYELWIDANDWKNHGIKIMRERSTFAW